MGGIICPPPDGVILRPPFSARVNPISGSLLATAISGYGGGGGCLGPTLRSRVLTGRFLKFKRHSIRLNMIYISKNRIFKNYYKGGIRGAKTMNFR